MSSIPTFDGFRKINTESGFLEISLHYEKISCKKFIITLIACAAISSFVFAALIFAKWPPGLAEALPYWMPYAALGTGGVASASALVLLLDSLYRERNLKKNIVKHHEEILGFISHAFDKSKSYPGRACVAEQSFGKNSLFVRSIIIVRDQKLSTHGTVHCNFEKFSSTLFEYNRPIIRFPDHSKAQIL